MQSNDLTELIDIRGIKIANVTPEEALSLATSAVENWKPGDAPFVVYTPNAEIAQLCVEDEKIRSCINSASLVVPDGAGIILASKILKTPLKRKVAGIELGEAIVRYSVSNGKSIYFLGASPANEAEGKIATAKLAEQKLAEKYPGFSVCGFHDGYFKEEQSDEIIADINASGADILFVCLGAPRQELWIYRNKSNINVPLMIGLGGSLDGYAGTVKRAPAVFIKLNCEWLYRLIKQPSRLRRMMRLPKYVFGTVFYRLKHKNKQK